MRLRSVPVSGYRLRSSASKISTSRPNRVRARSRTCESADDNIVFGVSELATHQVASRPPAAENFVYVSDAFCLVQFAVIGRAGDRRSSLKLTWLSQAMSD